MYGGSNKSPALTQIVKDKETFKITDNIHVRSSNLFLFQCSRLNEVIFAAA
jgi:hypothetical protein